MTKNHTTPTTVLLTVAVLAAVLVVACTTSAAAVLQPAAASGTYKSGEKNGGSGEKNGGSPSNSGISVTTNTDQLQNCQTAGGTSPITASCTAASTNTITESGGVIGAPR